jgi:predicted acetyltransferase
VSHSEVRLRPFAPGDESAALEANEALLEDNFPFLLFYESGEPWTGYLRRLEANRLGQPIGSMAVPASFLAASVNGELVGRISIRHDLDDWLAIYAGHIGYCVCAEHRRKGYATQMLRQGVIIARSLGVEDVLVTCNDTNVGSAATIEACGGELESVIDVNERSELLRRYWIR